MQFLSSGMEMGFPMGHCGPFMGGCGPCANPCANPCASQLSAGCGPFGGFGGFGGCSPFGGAGFGGCSPFGAAAFGGCSPFGGAGLGGCSPFGAAAFGGCSPFGGAGFGGCSPFGAAAFGGCSNGLGPLANPFAGAFGGFQGMGGFNGLGFGFPDCGVPQSPFAGIAPLAMPFGAGCGLPPTNNIFGGCGPFAGAGCNLFASQALASSPFNQGTVPFRGNIAPLAMPWNNLGGFGGFGGLSALAALGVGSCPC